MNSNITFREIFSDFINLSYSPSNKVVKSIKDINLRELTIARISSNGCTIHFLCSGESFYIPWKWIDIFTSFDVDYGGMMLAIERSINEDSDYLDRFGCYFNKFLKTLLNIPSSRVLNSQLLFELLFKIADLKTNKFIVWCKENFSLDLPNFEMITINGSINV